MAMSNKQFNQVIEALNHRLDKLAHDTEQRIRILEERIPVPKVLEGGWYDATIGNVERRKSRHRDRYYWTIEIVDIQGFPGKRLWLNRLERFRSPIEDVCAAFGAEIPPHTGEVTFMWHNSPARLVGKDCRVLVKQVQAYGGSPGTMMNEVIEIQPRLPGPL